MDEPVPGEALDRWLKSLLQFNGPDLLRFKGIINVAGMQGPIVVHGVQHVIYPPIALKSWPSDDRRTRMVFITYDIDETMLRDSLNKLTEEANAERFGEASACAAINSAISSPFAEDR